VMRSSNLAAAALLVGLAIPAAARADFSFSLPLTTGSGNKLDLGSFAGGTTLEVLTSGHGDLVDSRLQVNSDGSLFAPASGAYSFANPGAQYPTANGGDGINHFAGGGANFDATGSGYAFAGKMTTDTTDPAAIRAGAVVGTFSATPTRADWFLIGLDTTFLVPLLPTGAPSHLFVAVNDSVSGDNHGTYSGLVRINAVPEPSSLGLFGVAAVCGGGAWLIRRRTARRGHRVER
jgi:hypothetical protein